jgi:hypothetical protein
MTQLKEDLEKMCNELMSSLNKNDSTCSSLDKPMAKILLLLDKKRSLL